MQDQNLSFLPFFINEDLFLLPEDRQQKAPASSFQQAQAQAVSPATEAAAETPKKAATEQKAAPAEKANPKLIFGKNLKQLLILVEDPAHPVMERADGLFLKDVLKAIQYSFDDVAIVNIAHCRNHADWEALHALSFTHLFSFGVKHTKLPFTNTLAPYELERSENKQFLLTDTLSVLRAERSRKIALWNLLKQMFV